MLKLVVLALAVFAVTDAHRYRRAEPDLRVQATEVYENAKENFPMEEFQAFWGKVQEKSGMTQTELKAKFQQNKGNMDLTLEQVFDQGQDNYPILAQQWNRIQAGWEDNKNDMMEMKSEKFSALFNKAKTYLEANYGPVDFQRFKDNIGGYIAAFGMQGQRRFRRFAEPDLRAQATEVYQNAKTNFPMEEFQAFWGKVQEKSGMTQNELKAKFESNKGNMDLTLEQVFDKAQENYPILSQQWNRVQATWDDKKDDMLELKEDKFSELYEKAKAFLETKYGPIDFQKFKNNLSGYLAAVGMQTRRHRRHKREADLKAAYGQAKTHFEENFPKTEFDAFLSKLSENAQVTKGEIQAKLEANKGNMDLTLEEVADKAKSDYPIVSQQWNRIKNQWDTAKDDMDETTLQDLFAKAKGLFEEKFGNVNYEQFYNNIKNYIASSYAGPSRRRYRREIPTNLQPHVDQVKSHFNENFPKQEWDNFWPKFEEYMKSVGLDAHSQLEKNKGNMDLTLEEVKDQAMDKYPALQQQWSRVKNQMDECIGKMDETSVKDLFTVVKDHSEKVLGRPITETSLQGFVGNLQAYFSTFLNRMQTYRHYYY